MKKYKLFNSFEITVERGKENDSYKSVYHIIYKKDDEKLTDDEIYTCSYFETSNAFINELRELINKSISLLLENELITIFDINFQVIDKMLLDLACINI